METVTQQRMIHDTGEVILVLLVDSGNDDPHGSN